VARIARMHRFGQWCLLVLAGCSSTSRVEKTGPQPEAIAAAYRALIEAHPDFQMVAVLAEKEGKGVDWSKATQSTDPSGRWVAQIPLLWDEDNLELLIVTIEPERVSSVLLSRIGLVREKQAAQIALTDLSTRMVTTATVKTTEAKPVLQNVAWGLAKEPLLFLRCYSPVQPKYRYNAIGSILMLLLQSLHSRSLRRRCLGRALPGSRHIVGLWRLHIH